MKSCVAIAAALAALLMTVCDAAAIVRGHGAGAIGRHVVRLVGQGGLSCSATVVGPQEVLTSGHCIDGSDPYFVIAGGRRIKVASHSGYGGAARLALAIAGYGTAVESAHPRVGGLRATTLVSAGNSGALVDPNRRGASACMGDSGGPVARHDGRRYVLVGIIERASNPSPTRACGDLTHYVSVGGFGAWSGEATAARGDEPVRSRHRVRIRRAAR
jgi:secreted trypsin-like serine protease